MALPDDGVRGDTGLVLSIISLPNGRKRLIIDRARRRNGDWTMIGFSTAKEFDANELEEMSLSEADLEGLGLIVVAELQALIERFNKPGIPDQQ